MQSFLQYRRFGRHIKAQYERDRAKAEELKRQDEQDSQSISPITSSPLPASPVPSHTLGEVDTKDLEKGEPSGATNGNNTSNTDPTPQLLNCSNYNSIELSQTPAVSRQSMLRTIGTALAKTLTGVDTKPGEKGQKVFVVGYEGEKDTMDPHNWGFATRIGATINIAWIGWTVGFASSVDSAAIKQASADFGVSDVTESLATGLFLIGFGVGALFAGPISETVGRNPVYILTLSSYMIFIMASGLAPNIGAQLAFRFIAGFFGSTPLTCAGGSLSDLWNPMERVYAFPVFANAAFMGPIFGPIVGGFIGESPLVSWRWTEWITLIISGMVLAMVVLFQPETYAPILLKWKAAHLRALTGDQRYKAAVEVRERTFLDRLSEALYRPFLLTFKEPVILLLAAYLTVVYVILFTFLNGYTFIFTETYGFSQGITGLSFIAIGIGLCIASCLVPLIFVWAKKDLAKIKAKGGTQLPPEFRLWFAMLGAPAIPISMFWMGWTAYPSISPWSPLAASVVFGGGILCVFISSYQYIIDTYESYSASALASVTLIRYVAAGGMVEVAIPFYENLGVHWTLTVLGLISLLCVPLPYLFFIFGPRIRKHSKYAVVKLEDEA